jgi:AraC-like DNA-binding protein
LQFNEAIATDKVVNQKTADTYQSFSLLENLVLLTNSIMAARFHVPSNVRLRSVKLMFQKRHLSQYFDNDTIDTLISKYFSNLLKKGNGELIDADYRMLMNELIKEEIDHPFKLHFIVNRVMLLLERFVRKFLDKIRTAEDYSKFTEDEVSRLMRVEALLVKDFRTAPPTISSLSRIAAMSPTKLKTDFKALYGLPIYEYFQKNRMMHAKLLLLENKYSIKEVGNMVGYTNLGHFAGSFRKEFGILPSAIAVTPELTEPFEFSEIATK